MYTKKLDSTVLLYKGHQIHTEVTVSIEPEQYEYECDPPEDQALVNKKIEQGLLDHVVIQVKATCEGITGHSILGQCLIGGPDDLMFYVKEYDMVEEAMQDLKAEFDLAVNKFSKYKE